MVGIAVLVLVGVAVVAAALAARRGDEPSEVGSASPANGLVRRRGRRMGQLEPDRQVTTPTPTTSALGCRLRIVIALSLNHRRSCR